MLKPLLMHPRDKTPTQLCQDVVYQWPYTKENCNSYYIGELYTDYTHTDTLLLHILM